MVDRINLILKAKNLTSRQFAEEIGIQPSGMSHILSGRNRPSLDFVMKVVTRYPEIDIKWLTLGEGEMYVAPTSMPVSMAGPSPSRQVAPLSAPVSEPVSQRRPEMVEAPKTDNSNPVLRRDDVSMRDDETKTSPSVSERDLFSETEPSLFDEVEPSKEFRNLERPTSVDSQNATSADKQYNNEYRVVENEPRQTGESSYEPQGVESGLVYAKENASPLQRGDDPAAVPPVVQFAKNPVDSQVDENRVNGTAKPDGAEKRILAKKRVSKVIIFYDDHSFSEYYPE